MSAIVAARSNRERGTDVMSNWAKYRILNETLYYEDINKRKKTTKNTEPKLTVTY